MILGHPDRLAREFGSLVTNCVLAHDKHLARGRVELVGHGLIGNRVDHAVIADLEDTVAVDISLRTCRLGNDRLLRGITHEVGVLVIFREGHAILIVNGILEPINGRVNAEREHVLMERRHDSRADIRSPGNSLSVLVIEGDGRQDSSGADFELHVCSLIQNEDEDILVVCNRANHLDMQLTVARNGGGTGSVVRVLVLQAVVYLVHANNILQVNRVTLGVGTVAVKVLDVAQAVASKRELVGIDTKAAVSNIESLLAVVRSAGV